MVGVELSPGEIVLGRYRVQSRIGEGGMGAVYLAWHTTLEMPVAIKVIRPKQDPRATTDKPHARLYREARGLARIRSEFVCRPLDAGVLDSGGPFLVLEYLEGLSLLERVPRGLMPTSQTIDIVVQSAVGLAEAHRLGVVHRDIKPSNIFLATEQGGRVVAKVLDFGLSKVLDTDTQITSGDQLLGTPEFMSPEQIRAAPSVGIRTDIWSLGVVLFWALTGHLPFYGANRARVLAAIIDDEPTSLRSLRPDLPADLGKIVRDCLVKKPEGRVPTMASLVQRLQPFAGDEGKFAARLVAQTESVMTVRADPPATRVRAAADPTESMESGDVPFDEPSLRGPVTLVRKDRGDAGAPTMESPHEPSEIGPSLEVEAPPPGPAPLPEPAPDAAQRPLAGGPREFATPIRKNRRPE